MGVVFFVEGFFDGGEVHGGFDDVKVVWGYFFGDWFEEGGGVFVAWGKGF